MVIHLFLPVGQSLCYDDGILAFIEKIRISLETKEESNKKGGGRGGEREGENIYSDEIKEGVRKYYIKKLIKRYLQMLDIYFLLYLQYVFLLSLWNYYLDRQTGTKAEYR